MTDPDPVPRPVWEVVPVSELQYGDQVRPLDEPGPTAYVYKTDTDSFQAWMPPNIIVSSALPPWNTPVIPRIKVEHAATLPSPRTPEYIRADAVVGHDRPRRRLRPRPA